MARYTARVELYGSPTSDDYDKLRAAMQEAGFTETISFDGEATVWQLPRGEYNRKSDFDVDVIRDSAKRAAASAWADFGVLVTRCDGGRSIYNLKKA